MSTTDQQELCDHLKQHAGPAGDKAAVSLASKANDAWFVAAAHRVQRRFKAMICAIGDGRYFDAWLAAAQVRIALENAAQRANALPDEIRVSAVHHLDTMRSIAAPVLALAPSPNRDELRALRISDPEASRLAWERVEQRWRHALLCVCTDPRTPRALATRAPVAETRPSNHRNLPMNSLALELSSTTWTEALSRALQARGFASLTAYADSRPAASLTDLAVELDGPDTYPIVVEQKLVAEAEVAGTMEHCARSLLARDLRAVLPEGWQRGANGDETTGQAFRLSGVFLTLAMALPEPYQEAIDRVQRAMNAADLPTGWLPEGADDPALVELFGCYWAAPSMRTRAQTSTRTLTQCDVRTLWQSQFS